MVNMHLEKQLFQSNKHSYMDVEQNTFGDPIVVTALVRGKSVAATSYKDSQSSSTS